MMVIPGSIGRSGAPSGDPLPPAPAPPVPAAASGAAEPPAPASAPAVPELPLLPGAGLFPPDAQLAASDREQTNRVRAASFIPPDRLPQRPGTVQRRQIRRNRRGELGSC